MHPTLSINGRRIKVARLWRPEMSLSSARMNLQAAAYVLSLSKAAVWAALSQSYDALVRELKSDDSTTGTTDHLGMAGYPSLEELMNRQSLLSEVIVTYFQREVFATALPSPPSSQTGTYAVDTLSSAVCRDDVVVLEGTCYAL